jgi:hypothetical protein
MDWIGTLTNKDALKDGGASGKTFPSQLGSASWKVFRNSRCEHHLIFLLCKLMSKSARAARFG